MDRAALAVALATAADEEHHLLLMQHAELADASLAWVLKSMYDLVESSDVDHAAQLSFALASLARFTGDTESSAIASWVQGMVVLDDGQMEAALPHLEHAEAKFLQSDRELAAACSQISKFRALAMLGRFDEALQCGARAKDVFVQHNDLLSMGKIEQSIGNLHYLLDRYVQAEEHYRMARELYEGTDDLKQLTQIDNCLAMTLMSQHRFREAEVIYERARARAESGGLEITLAEIETNQGCLALYQGKYDRALDYLERARRRYAALGMSHQSAAADLEVADAYLELNLVPEAAAIYERVIPVFSRIGMVAEHARALANRAQARIALGLFEESRTSLAEAAALYEAAGNAVGKASVTLLRAQSYYLQQNHVTAAIFAREAEAPLAAVNAWGRLLLARWLQAEAARMHGQFYEAESLLQSTLREAEQWSVMPIIQQCHTSLGLLAEARGDLSGAEDFFKRAIASVEDARAPLPADEFRTAFLASKLIPYTEMVRVCLADGNPGRVAEALGYIERARSRALLDMLVGSVPTTTKARDEFESVLLARLEMLREELNWFYSQMNLPNSDLYERGTDGVAAFQLEVHERETAIHEITLQLRQRNTGVDSLADSIDIPALMSELGETTALVEYFSLDGNLMAFLLTNHGIELVRLSATDDDVEKALRQLHFQLGALRYGARSLDSHLSELTARTQHHLCKLHDLLMRPIEGRLGTRRLVVVPHRVLHYIPFQALYDGSTYLIERREVCCVPSAAVLQHCLVAPWKSPENATLLGHSDQRNPRAREEVLALTDAFSEVTMLLDEQATRASLLEYTGTSHVLHLACHGNFRLDNPSFSSLQLADGWLTVRDVYRLDLQSCELVTLSACETGVNHLAPGDEWIGLARGFFSAGAPSLFVSQWIVDDEATVRLMVGFYSRLQAGDRPAAALRDAQCQMLREKKHPYYWAPFMILGRW